MHDASRGRLAAALALGALALAPGAAQAQLAVEPDSLAVTEVTGNGNGVAEPGEALSVVARLISAEFDTLGSVTGTVASDASTAVVSDGEAAWPDLVFGTPTASTDPFAVALDAAHPCGAPVGLSLTLTTSAGPTAVALTLPTGARGAFSPADSTDAAQLIPDGGAWADATVTLSEDGRAKDLRVRVTRIDHPYPGDLRLELIAPDGRRVVLADGRGGAGSGYLDAVFDDSATDSIWSAGPPFTGSWRPQQPLATLDGAVLAGTWRLRVTDTSPGMVGSLHAWGLDTAPAVCAGAEPPPPPPPPPPPDPEPVKPGNGNGQANGWSKPCTGKGNRPSCR